MPDWTATARKETGMTLQTRAAAFATRIGLTGLAIAILIALLVVQTVRLEGFKMWPIRIEGALPKVTRLERTIDDIDKAQGLALAKAKAEKARVEQDYRNLAERINDDTADATDAAMDLADRYIANNRVRCPANRSASSGTVAAAGDSDTEFLEYLSADPVVSISDADLRACVGDATYAVGAYRWAQGLKETNDD